MCWCLLISPFEQHDFGGGEGCVCWCLLISPFEQHDFGCVCVCVCLSVSSSRRLSSVILEDAKNDSKMSVAVVGVVVGVAAVGVEHVNVDLATFAPRRRPHANDEQVAWVGLRSVFQ